MTDNLPVNADSSDLAALVSALPHHTDWTALLGVMIPIVAIVMGLGMGMLSLWLDYRKKREMFQLHHAERMAAIEKGVELPPLPPEFFRDHKYRERSPVRTLKFGLMWLLIGLAATAALWGTGERDAWWGLVPIGVGIAYLLSYAAERRLPPPPPSNSN